MIKRTLYLAGMLFFLARVQTYSQALAELSLTEAWALGVNNYPAFSENQALISAAAYQTQLVKSKYLPQLQTQLQNSYGTYAGSAGAIFPLPGIFNVSGNSDLENQANATTSLYGSVVMDWKIYDFGRRGKELEVAHLQEGVAEARFSAAQLAVQAQISSLYLAVLYNQANVKWAQTNAIRMREVLTLAKSLADAGLKPGADTLFVLASYRQALAESGNWHGKAQASKIQLTEVLAVPTDSFTLPGKAYLSASPAGLSPQAPLDTARHPYIQTLQQQVKVAQAQRQLAARKVFPSFSLLGGISTRGNGLAAKADQSGWSAGSGNRANNYLAGVGLTWNINSLYTTRVENLLAEQHILVSQSRYAVQALKQQTTLQAIGARLQEQQNQMANAKQAVQNARQAYDLYVSRYESGLISMTELLQLQFLLQQAEKYEIEAYQQFWAQVVQQAELTGDFSYLSNQF
jgi:outer membrane protein TolC